MAEKDKYMLLKISTGVLLLLSGVALFSKFVVSGNVLGVIGSAVLFFIGIWLISITIE